MKHDHPLELIRSLLPVVEEAAARFVLPRFRQPHTHETQTKSSPYDLVTLADEETEAFLIETLPTLFPGCVVAGEESLGRDPARYQTLLDADLGFLIDPVDGTFNFASGLALFGTIIAVFSKGKPIAGMLYDPIHRDLVIGALGEGAWYGRLDTYRRLTPTRSTAPIVTFNTLKYPIDFARDLAKATAPIAPYRSLQCAAEDYRAMIIGPSLMTIFRDAKPWDHAAGALILQEMGGLAQFLDGTPYSPTRWNGPLLAVQHAQDWDSVQQQLAFVLNDAGYLGTA